jgi:hypothetical protein
MLRLDDRAFMLSDGGLYRSVADFTMVGTGSKISKLTHLSAAMSSVGNSTLRLLIEFNHATSWRSFDHMIKVLPDNTREELARFYYLFPTHRPILVVFAVIGWSDQRNRFENYTMQVEGYDVGPIVPAPQMWHAPDPAKEALVEHGFDGLNVNINDPMVDLVRFMEAQRSTRFPMGEIGDDADSAKTGHTVGAFIERVVIEKDVIFSDIPLRWPDVVGEMIVLP